MSKKNKKHLSGMNKEETMKLVNLIAERVKDQLIEEINNQFTDTKEILSDDLDNFIKDKVEDYAEEHAEKYSKKHEEIRNKNRKLYKRIIDSMENFQNKLEIYYRMPYIFLAMSGVMLFWYGAWRILGDIPMFEDGMLPFIIGLLLLIITGRVARTFAN